MRTKTRKWMGVCAGVLLWIAALGYGLSGAIHHSNAAIGQVGVPTSAATIAYLAPTVVPATPTVPASPTPTQREAPQTAPPPPPPGPVPPGPDPVGGVPQIGGQLLLVSLSQQWLWAYQNGQLLYRTPVTTGMPELATPDGVFHIRFHESNVMFYSPWPQGSPYYYSPVHVNYAMYFADWGYYLHDAPWRPVFGPGTNISHTDPDGVVRTGSHGCVEVPTAAGAWLYRWAYNGAALDVYGWAPTTPPPTPTAIPSPTIQATPTDTPSPSPGPSPTADASPSPTATSAPTATATATSTATPTATVAPTPTDTPAG